MSASSVQDPIFNDILLDCLACGDPFTPQRVADGVLPILFSCGHTVCVDCAKTVALAIPGFEGKWACGWCKRGDGGAVNAGVLALVRCLSAGGVEMGPATKRFQADMEPIEGPSAPFDFSALSGEAGEAGEAGDAIATALSDLQRVSTACATMRAGYESSRIAFITGIDSLLSAVIAHRDRVLGEAKLLFDAREKALATQVEELSMKVSLLRQAVDVCKVVVNGGVEASPAVYGSVRMSVKGLTAAPFAGLSVCPVAGVGVDVQGAIAAVEGNMFVERGVSAPDCELSGPGLQAFFGGGGTRVDDLHQRIVFTVACRDSRRGAVDCVHARDVLVRVLSVGGGVDALAGLVVSIAPVIDAPGVFEVVYAVSERDAYAVDVDVRVYGEPVSRSPVTVYGSFTYLGSTVLSSVPHRTLESFYKGIWTWLPDADIPVLLFRMSRDGTATSDFHSRCDGVASTLTLIKSSNGFVFGGYAGAAWASGFGQPITCSRSFIFTVSNPHDIPPTRYPVNTPDRALIGMGACGPYFGGGAIGVGDGDDSLISAGWTPFNHYTDTTGLGAATFTGAPAPGYFTAAEIEVWQVPMRK